VLKLNILEKFEEQFYFKTSHLFWHLLTGLGALVLVIGIFIFLWGILPPFKPGVKKPKLPKPVKVEAVEVMQIIRPGSVKKGNIQPLPTTSESKGKAGNLKNNENLDGAKLAYINSLNKMKKLLPPKKFAWKSRGYWKQSLWEKKWVVSTVGIEDRLNAVYRKVKAKDYKSKKKLLDAYISFIRPFPIDKRLPVLKSGILISKGTVTDAIQNISLLKISADHFPNSYKVDCIKILATFSSKNPRDGIAFIEYVNSIIPKFKPKIRKNILTTLVSSYYRFFNDIDQQKEATNMFLNIQKSFIPDIQAKALSTYYNIFIQKNAGRSIKIAQLKQKYQDELEEAQSIYFKRKAKKVTYRVLGWEVIAGSILFISLSSLFLVLLSIQREIKKLREISNPIK